MSPEVRIETCSKHGLRYNAATTNGCARCLREASGNLPTQPTQSTDKTAMAPHAMIAALLIAGSGFLFFSVHQELLKSWQGLFGPTEQEDMFEVSETSGLDDELESFLLFCESPIVEFTRRENPELDRQISELEDPEKRSHLSEDEILDRIDHLYEVIYGGEAFD